MVRTVRSERWSNREGREVKHKLSPRQAKSTSDRAKEIDHFLEVLEALLESGQVREAYIQIKKVRHTLSKWKNWL
jgi:hypothetical protein